MPQRSKPTVASSTVTFKKPSSARGRNLYASISGRSAMQSMGLWGNEVTVFLLHGHHNACISEYETREEAMARVKHIRDGLKPPDETPTRLRLMRILTDEEAAGWIAAHTAWTAARSAAWSAAGSAAGSAAWSAAWAAAWSVAWLAAAEALKEAEILWHRSVCVADCPWDGETIFPEKKGT